MDTVLGPITLQTVSLMCWGVVGLCVGIVAGLFLKEHQDNARDDKIAVKDWHEREDQ